MYHIGYVYCSVALICGRLCEMVSVDDVRLGIRGFYASVSS